jgi:methylenetetrahydrofolate dehydrogenase (NADP+)/methenyltetrahydrofolate cyclohydrolase
VNDQINPARILDGKALAAEIRAELAREIAPLDAKPGLAVILVGDDPASQVYVAGKIKACAEAGIRSTEKKLPAAVTNDDVAVVIDELNAAEDVHGILLQLPLPDHLDENMLVQRIAPDKDVDGLTVANAGRLFAGLDGLVPCTPQGALALDCLVVGSAP